MSVLDVRRSSCSLARPALPPSPPTPSCGTTRCSGGRAAGRRRGDEVELSRRRRMGRSSEGGRARAGLTRFNVCRRVSRCRVVGEGACRASAMACRGEGEEVARRVVLAPPTVSRSARCTCGRRSTCIEHRTRCPAPCCRPATQTSCACPQLFAGEARTDLVTEAAGLVRARRARRAVEDRKLAVLPAADAEEEAEDVRLLALVELGLLRRRRTRVSVCAHGSRGGEAYSRERRTKYLKAPILVWQRQEEKVERRRGGGGGVSRRV